MIKSFQARYSRSAVHQSTASGRRAHRGGAMIEFALVLPILLTVLFGIVDLSRAIQFDNVLVHITREGANLASRTTVPPNNIIAVLSRTAQPLDINQDGMIYITRVEGLANGRARVEEQYRATQGQNSLQSQLYNCPAWQGDGSCQLPGVKPTIQLAAPLAEGEQVSIVEARYDYQLFTQYLFNAGPDLYAVTAL
ncbi:MAG: TadE/TadG family type IV pilus assembly protein [Burkholderiaceae bacterium]